MPKVFILFTILGLVVFGQALRSSFVWDDYGQIVINTTIHSWQNLGSVWDGGTFAGRASNQPVGSFYRPIVSIGFGIIYLIFGPNAGIYHGIVLLTHIINSCLLFLYLRRKFPSFEAGLAAAIFLVHPINVTTAVYISA